MPHPEKEKEPLTVDAIRKAHVKQLQWAVQFIRQNLGELGAGEWLSLQEALYDLSFDAKGFPSTRRSDVFGDSFAYIDKYDEERFVQAMSSDAVQDIQRRMIHWFKGLVQHKNTTTTMSYGFGVNEVAFHFSCSSTQSPFV